MAEATKERLDPPTAVATVAARVADLVRSLPDVADPVVGSWSVRELATHVTHVYQFGVELAVGAHATLEDFTQLGSFTVDLVHGDTERDPVALAERIEVGAERFLATMAGPDASLEAHWLAGIRLPRSALFGYVLLESLIHGFDLARATGRPWAVDPGHARVVVRDFIFELLPRLGPTDMVSDRAARARATFDLQVRGVGARRLAFDRGTLAVGPAGGNVDCHVSADPATLLLVSFKRVGLWGPIARGQLLAWGRKPWLGLQLPGFLATP